MFEEIAESIGEVLKTKVPGKWIGRDAILEMKDSGCRQWRQMEWMGFYFQYLCEVHLRPSMDIPGPQYGSVVFDAFKSIPWDFKTHAINTSSHQVIVNDSEAVASAIAEYGSVGLILALGKVEYNDEKRSFQNWHDGIKGKPSRYVKERIKRGAWSRLRKVSVDLQQIDFIEIKDSTLVKCGSFQQDFRNADGSSRRAKVLLNLEDIDEELKYFVEF